MICSPNVEKLSVENPVENNQLGFSVAEKHLGISSLLNPAEMESPDRLALVTYLSLFYELFHGSQPVALPTGAEHDSKAKKPTVSKSSHEKSTKKMGTGEVTSTETSTSSKKPTSTEKHIISSEKKSSEKSFTSSQKQLTSPEKQVTSDKKSLSVATSSTSSQKSITTSEKQVASSQKPFAPSEKQATSAEKATSLQTASTVSAEKQISLTKKSNSPIPTVGKPGASAETLVEKQITTTDKCTASAESEQVEPPPKKKSKKKRFRLFSRKKKSLATATPSIER